MSAHAEGTVVDAWEGYVVLDAKGRIVCWPNSTPKLAIHHSPQSLAPGETLEPITFRRSGFTCEPASAAFRQRANDQARMLDNYLTAEATNARSRDPAAPQLPAGVDAASALTAMPTRGKLRQMLRAKTQDLITQYMEKHRAPIDTTELMDVTGDERHTINEALTRMLEKGLVQRSRGARQHGQRGRVPWKYALTQPGRDR